MLPQCYNKFKLPNVRISIQKHLFYYLCSHITVAYIIWSSCRSVYFSYSFFQKFSTYQFHAAFVIADFEQLSPRVAELALDHQNHPCVRLFGDVAEAEAWIKLLQQQQQ